MSRHPLFARLATQLVPAVLVAIVGLLALANLARTPEPAPAAAPTATAITTEAVFTATPREAAEEPAKAVAPRPPANPKTAAPLPPRKPEPVPPRQTASAPAPLPTVQVAEPALPPPPPADDSMMGRLRSATMSVVQAPQRAARSMAGWFQPSGEPPRPPETVPQNFQAQM